MSAACQGCRHHALCRQPEVEALRNGTCSLLTRAEMRAANVQGSAHVSSMYGVCIVPAASHRSYMQHQLLDVFFLRDICPAEGAAAVWDQFGIRWRCRSKLTSIVERCRRRNQAKLGPKPTCFHIQSKLCSYVLVVGSATEKCSPDTCFKVSCAPASSTSAITTAIPSFANPRQAARPMPLAPPVTSATLGMLICDGTRGTTERTGRSMRNDCSERIRCVAVAVVQAPKTGVQCTAQYWIDTADLIAHACKLRCAFIGRYYTLRQPHVFD